MLHKDNKKSHNGSRHCEDPSVLMQSFYVLVAKNYLLPASSSAYKRRCSPVHPGGLNKGIKAIVYFTRSLYMYQCAEVLANTDTQTHTHSHTSSNSGYVCAFRPTCVQCAPAAWKASAVISSACQPNDRKGREEDTAIRENFVHEPVAPTPTYAQTH